MIYTHSEFQSTKKRLNPLSRCSFGEKLVPCVAAHNYFWDPDPVVNARGPIIVWPNNGCEIEPVAKSWANITASVRLTENDGSGDENEPSSVIVFVRRGGCSFADKVLTILAATTGSDSAVQPVQCAAIVIVDSPQPARSDDASLNTAPPPLTAPGFGDVPGIHVPVVMVAHADVAMFNWNPYEVETNVDGLVHAHFESFDASSTDVHRANPNHSDEEVAEVTIKGSPRLIGEVVLVSATLDSLRGRGQCQCSVEAPLEMAEWHLMHREG